MFVCNDLRRLLRNLEDEDGRVKWVEEMSDRNLFDVLTACHQSTVGPVVSSTRSLYRKILIDLLKTSPTRQIVESIDQHLAMNTDALEQWEASGMRQYEGKEDESDQNEGCDFNETLDEPEAPSSDRGGTLSRAGALSYAAVLSGRTDDTNGIRDSSPCPVPPSPFKSGNEMSPTLRSCDLSNVAGGYDDPQNNSYLNDSELFTTIRKREKGRDQFLQNSPPQAKVEGNGAVGNLQFNYGGSKLKILCYCFGLAALIWLVNYQLGIFTTTGDAAEIDTDSQDELDILLKAMGNE